MLGYGKYVVVILLLAGSSVLGLTAQDKPAGKTDGEEYPDAIGYSMQKRYRPQDEDFRAYKWSDNTFVSGYVSAVQIAPYGDLISTWGPSMGISYGKWLNRYNALRLTFAGDVFARNSDNLKPWNLGLDLSHMFNVISYIDGYRRSRFCEIHTVFGLGYRMSVMQADVTHVGNVHMGLNVSMKTGRHIDLFVEPLVSLQNDAVLHCGNEHWRGYVFSYGAKLGLSFNFLDDYGTRPDVDYSSDTFIAFSGGTQFQNSSVVYRTVGLLRSLGHHAAVSYGKWYTGFFALRSSAFWSSDIWGKYYDNQLRCHYAGLRLEGMLDVLGFGNGGRDGRRLAASILFGPEAGMIYKEDISTRMLHPYLGIGGGLQLNYVVANPVSVFLEPRFSLIPYSHADASVKDIGDVRHNYYDCTLSVNLGLEIRLFTKK